MLQAEVPVPTEYVHGDSCEPFVHDLRDPGFGPPTSSSSRRGQTNVRGFGLLSRVAYRTLHAYLSAALGEADAVPGAISLAQSFGSLVHFHPHLHLVVTDGALRRDGSFVAIRAHD